MYIGNKPTAQDIIDLKQEQASLIEATTDAECIAYAHSEWQLCQRLEYITDILNGAI